MLKKGDSQLQRDADEKLRTPLSKKILELKVGYLKTTPEKVVRLSVTQLLFTGDRT
jgi:hypothetical protein